MIKTRDFAFFCFVLLFVSNSIGLDLDSHVSKLLTQANNKILIGFVYFTSRENKVINFALDKYKQQQQRQCDV